MRKAAALILAALLTTTGPVGSAPTLGMIQGTITVSGRPLSGVGIALVDLQSGAVHRAVSEAKGAFEARVAPGQYAVTTENRAGLVVSKAPATISVVAGRVASAQIELLALPAAVLQDATAPPPPTQAPPAEPAAPAPNLPAVPGQEPPVTGAPTTGAAINFDAVTCFVAGEFPLLDAGIEPMATVARSRVYFRAAQGTSFYYVEMTQDQGRFFGKLPRPKVEASPITYYLQATTTEFEESQTPEIEAIVVEKKDDCGDRKIAAFGPPGEVTVFSAATGASIAPAGFAAGGAALAAGTIAVVAGGAAAAGITAGIITNPTPTPLPTGTPTPVPTPTPTPTPIPTPKPTPTPSPTPIPTPRPTPIS
jgi:hypothetical protein